MNLRTLIFCIPLLVLNCNLIAQDARPEEPGRRFVNRVAATRTEQDIEDASTFMQEHAPNRWRLIQNLPEEGAIRRGVMGYMVARYKSLLNIREEDSKLYELKLNQLKTEDDIFGIVSSAHTTEDRQKHSIQITESVRKMVDLNITEREMRIERLKTSLAAEEQRLANDRKVVDSVVKERVEKLIAEGAQAMRRDMLPGRGVMPPRHEPRPASQPTRRTE